MHAIDTNVLVRLIARDNTAQVVAAEEFVASGAWVSVLALAESTWVLSSVYDLSAKDLVQAIEMLLGHQNLVVQEAETVAAALQLFRGKPALGFTDCLMLESARRAGYLPLGTFDRDLARMPGAQKI